MRAGRISARMGLYNEAASLFRRLADLDGSEYRPAARLELSRALIELGDWQMSLLILRNLDEHFPPLDPSEKTARALVRASAQNARGAPIESLRELDGMDESFDPLGTWEALAIRARALEAMSLPGDAARAWLAYSRNANDQERERALKEAARLTLEAGDELGVLFICREAARLGVADGFPVYQRKARQALGFVVAGDAAGAGIEDRIEHGESLLGLNEIAFAAPVFESLFAGRQGLSEAQAARVCVGWATCVAENSGFEASIEILSEERARYQTLEAKKRLDMVAASLLEEAGLLERAVDAYQGSY